jgi:hypothetical protein
VASGSDILVTLPNQFISFPWRILFFAAPEYLVMLHIVKVEGIDAAPHEI